MLNIPWDNCCYDAYKTYQYSTYLVIVMPKAKLNIAPDKEHTSCAVVKKACLSPQYHMDWLGCALRRKWLGQSIAPTTCSKTCWFHVSGHAIVEICVVEFWQNVATSLEHVLAETQNKVPNCDNSGLWCSQFITISSLTSEFNTIPTTRVPEPKYARGTQIDALYLWWISSNKVS